MLQPCVDSGSKVKRREANTLAFLKAAKAYLKHFLDKAFSLV